MSFYVRQQMFQVETSSEFKTFLFKDHAEQVYQKYVNQKIPCEIYKEGKLLKEYKPKWINYGKMFSRKEIIVWILAAIVGILLAYVCRLEAVVLWKNCGIAGKKCEEMLMFYVEILF